MSIDFLVKVSQIATPFVILGFGFLLNKSIQNHGQNIKVSSEFNTKWSDEFITKVKAYSTKISDLQHAIFEMAENGRKGESAKKYNSLLKDLQRDYYEIEIHSSLIDNADNVLKTVKEIFEQTKSNVSSVKDGGYVNFDQIKKLQTNLHKELKTMQKQVLKI